LANRQVISIPTQPRDRLEIIKKYFFSGQLEPAVLKEDNQDLPISFEIDDKGVIHMPDGYAILK
jgi:hypothetical protein